MYDSRRRRWTGKLRILGEDQEAVLVDKRAIGDELFALGYGVGIDLGGWAFLQDGGGTLEYDEAVRRTLAPRLGALVAAEEYAAGLSFRGGLSDRRENVGAEDGEELRLVLLESIANDLRLADVSARGVGKRVAANEDIDSGLVEFLASEKLVQFGAGRGDSLAGPVRDLGSA